MRYHVFIEGPRDATAAGIELLAAALARHYGASPPEVLERLKQGRFCARSALDLTPAQRLAQELEALGAATSVVPDLERGAPRYESGLAAAFAGSSLRDDVGLDLGVLGSPEVAELGDLGWTLAHVDGTTDPAPPVAPTAPTAIETGRRRAARADGTEPGDPPARAAPVRLGSAAPPPIPRAPGRAGPPPVPRDDGAHGVPAGPRDGGSQAAPDVSRESGSHAAPAVTRDSGPRAAPAVTRDSGPRAAPAVSRDGGAHAAPAVSRDGGPRGAPPARAHVLPRHGPHSTEPPIGIAADDESTRVDPAQAAIPPAPPRFEGAPPDAPAPDPFRPPDLDRPLPRLATLPIKLFTADSAPAGTAQATAAPAATGSTLIRPTLGARTRDAIGGSARGRLLAGLLLAFAIGFVPALLYASSRARSAYDEVRADLVAEYGAADTPDRWRTLAAARAEAESLLDARRGRVVVSACLLWAAVAGAVGFAWFRLVRDPTEPHPA